MRFVGQDAAPVWVQLVFIAVGPPIMALLFAVLSRGWAGAVAGILGRRVSGTTKREQAWEFWFVLLTCYAVAIGVMVYAHVFH